MEGPVELYLSVAEKLLYYPNPDLDWIGSQHSEPQEQKSVSSLLDFLSSSSYLPCLPVLDFWISQEI